VIVGPLPNGLPGALRLSRLESLTLRGFPLTHSVVRPVRRGGSALTAGALVGQCMPPRQARGQPLHPIYAPLLLTREVAANVRCGIGSSAVPGTAVSESGRLRQGPTAIREATAAAAC